MTSSWRITRGQDSGAQQLCQVGRVGSRRRELQLRFNARQMLEHEARGLARIAQADRINQRTVLPTTAGGSLPPLPRVAGAVSHEDERGARDQLAQDTAQ